MIAAVRLTYIVCSTVGIVIPTTVSVISFSCSKRFVLIFNILSFSSPLHNLGCTDYPPIIYIFSEVDNVIQ